MASLDVDSLFTNIPINETINLCVNQLYPNNNSIVKGIPKQNFRRLLQLSTCESFFMFNGSYYKQVDGCYGLTPGTNIGQRVHVLS